MSAVVTSEALFRKLATEPILRLSPSEWDTARASCQISERHPTGVAGDLIVIAAPTGFAAVEQPNASEYVVRSLATQDDVRRFVDKRLEQYARMWDGCGCKIDYYR